MACQVLSRTRLGEGAKPWMLPLKSFETGREHKLNLLGSR